MNVNYQNYYVQHASQEADFSAVCAVPFIGILTGLIRAILGAKQALSGVINLAKKDTSLSQHGWVQIKHGLANVAAGCVEAIPFIGTISAICRVAFDNNSKLFMSYPRSQPAHATKQPSPPQPPQPALDPVPQPTTHLAQMPEHTSAPSPALDLVPESAMEPASQPTFDLALQFTFQLNSASNILTNIEDTKKQLKVYEERLALFDRKSFAPDGDPEYGKAPVDIHVDQKIINLETMTDALKTTLQILERMEKFTNS